MAIIGNIPYFQTNPNSNCLECWVAMCSWGFSHDNTSFGSDSHAHRPVMTLEWFLGPKQKCKTLLNSERVTMKCLGLHTPQCSKTYPGEYRCRTCQEAGLRVTAPTNLRFVCPILLIFTVLAGFVWQLWMEHDGNIAVEQQCLEFLGQILE